MTSRSRHITWALIAACMLFSTAFAHQADSQLNSPAITASPDNSPSNASQQSSSQPVPNSPVNSGTSQKIPNKSATLKPAKKHLAKRPDVNTPPAVPSALVGIGALERTVVRNGGAREIRLQLTPTATPEQTTQRRRQTRELLAVSNENLKRITPLHLDPNQEDMLQQVHNYMEQARIADKTGELQRAQMLASKARQLSDDLVGARIFPKLWPW